ARSGRARESTRADKSDCMWFFGPPAGPAPRALPRAGSLGFALCRRSDYQTPAPGDGRPALDGGRQLHVKLERVGSPAVGELLGSVQFQPEALVLGIEAHHLIAQLLDGDLRQAPLQFLE